MKYPDIFEMSLTTERPKTVEGIAERVFQQACQLYKEEGSLIPVVHIIGKDMGVTPVLLGDEMSKDDIRDFLKSQAAPDVAAILFSINADIKEISKKESESVDPEKVSMEGALDSLITVCYHPEGTQSRVIQFIGDRVAFNQPWEDMTPPEGSMFCNPFLEK